MNTSRRLMETMDANGYDAEMNTEYIREEVGNCESVEELKDRILPLLKSQSAAWAEKVAQIMEEGGYNQSSFAQACGVSRQTVIKWCKGAVPKNRETFIRIGIAAHYDRDGINRLLVRNGRYPALYAKTLEDCVALYIINGAYGEDAGAQYRDILGRIRDSIMLRKKAAAEAGYMETIAVNAELSRVRTPDELEQFIRDNSAIFALSYRTLYAHIKSNLAANYGEHVTTYELALSQDWSSSLRQCISAINQGTWYPTRNKIISIGLHLNMTCEEVNDMLALAHMEPLCAKNPFESVMIYVMEDADLNGLLEEENEDGETNEDYDPDVLVKYARDVLREVNIPEMADFLQELPDDEDDDRNE